MRYPLIVQLYPDLFNSIHVLRQQSTEICICHYLKNSQIISENQFTSFHPNELAINPRSLLEKIISLNASSIVLLHNHPSNYCYPSQADVMSTEIISDLGTVLEFTIVDHIIITSEDYFSFQEAGMIETSSACSEAGSFKPVVKLR